MRIEHTYNFDELTPEKIQAYEQTLVERAARNKGPAVPTCSLLMSLRRMNEEQAANRHESSVDLDKYLVENGLKTKACELIANQLLSPATSDDSALLERTLRSKFGEFDATGTEGFVDIADFAKLLARLKEAPQHENLQDKEVSRVEVNQDGKIRYDAFVTWWLRRD